MLRSLINQRLGRYYIKELLGRGGMAAVYRATDTALQRDVALKILYPQYSEDAALVERFQREAVTAAALEHPSIVSVYDVGEQDGMAYIAMRLLSGQTLQDRLQAAGRIDLDELLAVLTPVAAALDYAHARGVVHRDIKPGNIFLHETPDGQRVLLTDFGIAKQLDTPGLTTTGALIGTPDYMAPEQIGGRPVDARTDVYALGMLVYRALTGRRAFEGSTQDVLLGHLYERPAPPSQVNPALPPALDAVIDQATAREPAERFPSAGAFVQALRQAARGAAAGAAAGTAVGLPPALARPPQAPPRPPPTQQRTAPSEFVRRPPPAAPAAATVAATAETSGGPTIPRAAPASAAPWLAAIVLALIAGGLAVALLFALGRQGNAAGAPTPLPPETPVAAAPTGSPDEAQPPSPTAEPTATLEPATATAEPSATAAASPTATEAASPTAEPSATRAPTRPPPPTAAPPTATDEPTATPSATATATATASPTPVTPTAVADCDDDLMTGGFERIYAADLDVRLGLGCPLEREVAGRGSEQFFERGTMFYWDERNDPPMDDYIFVFYGLDEGRYDELSPEEVAEYPEPPPGDDPNQPIRGFGRVYFGHEGTAEQLGRWTSPEIELKGNRPAVIQLFEQGMMIYTPIYEPAGMPAIFVLYNNEQQFERFDDPSGG